MGIPVRYIVRFMAILGVAIVLSVLAAPRTATNSPYASAISEMVVTTVHAAPVPCTLTACGPGNVYCRASPTYNKCTPAGAHGNCHSSAC